MLLWGTAPSIPKERSARGTRSAEDGSMKPMLSTTSRTHRPRAFGRWRRTSPTRETTPTLIAAWADAHEEVQTHGSGAPCAWLVCTNRVWVASTGRQLEQIKDALTAHGAAMDAQQRGKWRSSRARHASSRKATRTGVHLGVHGAAHFLSFLSSAPTARRRCPGCRCAYRWVITGVE